MRGFSRFIVCFSSFDPPALLTPYRRGRGGLEIRGPRRACGRGGVFLCEDTGGCAFRAGPLAESVRRFLCRRPQGDLFFWGCL